MVIKCWRVLQCFFEAVRQVDVDGGTIRREAKPRSRERTGGDTEGAAGTQARIRWSFFFGNLRCAAVHTSSLDNYSSISSSEHLHVTVIC